MNPRRTTPSYKATDTPNSANRALNMQLLVFFIGLVLVVRLFYLQVVKYKHYNELAVAEHQKKYTIPASRGTLYFRDGDDVVPAVLNSTVYTLYGDPREVKSIDTVSAKLASSLQLNQKTVSDLLKTKDTEYVVLAKRLSKDQVNTLFKDKSDLQGINVTPVPQRVYPEGTLGSQLLGFVNDEGVGQYGVESALNTALQGTPGELKAITDVNGVPLSIDDSTNIAVAPKDGQDTVLTVDRNIQAEAESALTTGLKNANATRGSVIVMDPNTGAVRAMANLPTFDPAKYYDVGDNAYEKFQNRVVSDQYEAGSVMKVLTLATGLDTGVIQEDTHFNNTGIVKVDDATITNVDQVPGSRSMTDILKYSLNTGVVWVLSQMGGGNINAQARNQLYNYFTNHFQFGALTGIEQGGEATGSIYGPNTVQGNDVRYSNMAFGQGVGVTMVQVASAFSGLINGGNYYKPHVVEGTMNADGSVDDQVPKPEHTNEVSAKTSAAIRDMTYNSLQQTPAIANLLTSGYYVGGKTGTSQTIDPATGKYTDAATVGSYLGYGGDTNKPKYVIMVRVDDPHTVGYSGSAAAAPIFAEISNWLINYYNIKPM